VPGQHGLFGAGAFHRVVFRVGRKAGGQPPGPPGIFVNRK
jgi:hypothetical protein